MEPNASDLPLADIKILDFSRLLPGPWCTQFLGDLGAEVIKVESPESGDPSRHNPPLYSETSAYFNSVNGNKTSLTLDLRAKGAQEVLARLVDWADVVVESFSVGTAKRLGIDYDSLRALKPSLIYCSISGFGQSGPLSTVPGHDLVIQAAAGNLQAAPDRMPCFQAGDYAAASVATIGILSAIRRRDRTGVGANLDVAMFDSLMAMGNIALAPALSRAGNGSGMPALQVWGANPRYAIYPTRDGKTVAVCLLEARLWRQFCAAIGRPDLISDAEGPADRHSDHGDLGRQYQEAVSAFCATHDRDEIVRIMAEHSLPIIGVHSADEALAGDHAQARGMVRAVPHPVEGEIPELANPLQAAGLARTRRAPAPALGGDTDRVLERLGYGEAERLALHRAKVV
ncbi:CoA:oxalate CoA-transferase [Rhodoligotrophos appendicifer]|uniref:CaiB/BaiF CoA transferase family protein n=1 Tax=Rhodoligotrophos appendicifer TaxID=987056 RepID=UPI001185ED6B|nr:CoA transferase [Rhodoligotrophos appendicifer]